MKIRVNTFTEAVLVLAGIGMLISCGLTALLLIATPGVPKFIIVVLFSFMAMGSGFIIYKEEIGKIIDDLNKEKEND